MLPRGKFPRMTGMDEAGEERVWLERLRLELRMELHRDVPRMRWQFDDFNELAVERSPDDLQAMIGQRLFIQAIEFVPVSMAFVNDRLTVKLMRSGSGLQFAGIRSQAHRAAKIVHPEQIAQLVYDLLRCVGGTLG